LLFLKAIKDKFDSGRYAQFVELPLPPALGDDFVSPLRVALAGMVNRLEPRAVVTTPLTQNRPGAMLRMKSRIICKDFRALLAHRAILNPARHGAMALGLWSHKLLRWFVPYFLLALFSSSMALCREPLPRLALITQVAFYALAIAGVALRKSRRASLFTIPSSFCVVNLAALLGTARCLVGKTSARWTPLRQSRPAAHRSLAPHADSDSIGEK
jgi:hypothetical protein